MPDTTQPTQTATLSFKDKTLELPMYSPTEGPDVVDITKLYSQGGVFTYDPGFTSTASCESTITYMMATRAFFFIAAILSVSWPKRATISRFATCCFTANCRPVRSSRISNPV